MEKLSCNSGEVAYDDDIFPFIVKNNSQYYRRFQIENYSEVKSLFVNGTDQVRANYNFLFDSNLENKFEALDYLENNLLQKSTRHPLVIDLYKDKIHEKKLLLQLVRSAYYAQSESGVGLAASRDFKQLTETIFGEPNVELFEQVVIKIIEDISVLSTELKSTTSYHRLFKLLSKYSRKSKVDSDRNLVLAQQSGDVYIETAEEVKQFFDAKMKSDKFVGWHVEVSEKSVSSFRIYVDSKTIMIPKTEVLKNRKIERRLTPLVLEGIFTHEVLTHVVRSINGEKSKLKLLSLGLASYLRGEEGIATYREQCINKSHTYAGETKYFAISIAYGLDREMKPRTFREVYNILCDYFHLKFGLFNHVVTSKAFAICTSIFVFSSHQDKHLIFTRDILYREGDFVIRKLLESNPELETWFDVGKFDPANNKHVDALQKLGIINPDR